MTRLIGRRRLLGALAAVAASAAVGCGQATPTPGAPKPVASGAGAASVAGLVDYSPRFAAFEPAEEPNADPAKVVWPPWMDRYPAEVKRLYEFQLVNGELMKYMPCFCGCNAEDGHRNNRDCYVEEVKPDGSVVFDRMAPT